MLAFYLKTQLYYDVVQKRGVKSILTFRHQYTVAHRVEFFDESFKTAHQYLIPRAIIFFMVLSAVKTIEDALQDAFQIIALRNKDVNQRVKRFTPYSTPIKLRAIKPPSQTTILGGGFI